MRSRLGWFWWFVGVVSLVSLPACGGGTPPPGTMPVYEVTEGSVVTPAKAAALAAALGLPEDVDILDEDGALAYLDAELFLAVPMLPAATSLAIEPGDDPDPPSLFERFDFDAINALRPVPEAAALARVTDALRAAGLAPAGLGIGGLGATPDVSYARFEAFDIKRNGVVAEALLDGQVAYTLKLGTERLVGPGAVVQISLNGAGTPTQLAYALRGVRRAGFVPVVSSARAAARAEALHLAANPGVSPLDVTYDCGEVVYYAPPLSLAGVTRLFPHYDCAGTVSTGGLATQQATAAQLLQSFVPAVEDVPRATLTAAITAGPDSLVLGYAVTVEGGTGPYTIHVSSGTTEYQQTFEVTASKSDDYPVYPYSLKTEEPFESERVTVTVTDANGLAGAPVAREVAFPVVNGLAARAPALVPAVSGVVDFGITRGVCDLGAGIHNGFLFRMAGSALPRFNYACRSSWEKDFREPPSGLDPQIVDNVDLVLYVGHGWPGGFTFDAAAKDDDALRHDDGARWGNQDLEWLALVSCQVLAYDAPNDGGRWHERWGQEFDGLHMILGFATNAYDIPDFGQRFADWMLGRNIGFTTRTLPIRSAWLQATREQQPMLVFAAVMGVYGPGGITSYNDYFHGKGPVSPDLRVDQYEGWWYVVGR